MPLFFRGAPGRTSALFDPAVQASVMQAGVLPGLGWQAHRSIITRVTMSQQGNAQFLHTLGNVVYIYVFGDRVGSLTLSGLSFAADCDDAALDHGSERVLDWYRFNRLAAREGPVRVVLGMRTAFDAFVVRLDQDAADPQLRLTTWSLQLAIPPEK